VHSFESAPREAIIIRARGAAPGEVIDNLTAKYQMAISNVGRCNIDREAYTYTTTTVTLPILSRIRYEERSN
jgi:hypothetical protein